jgi:hypothetical protein
VTPAPSEKVSSAKLRERYLALGSTGNINPR